MDLYMKNRSIKSWQNIIYFTIAVLIIINLWDFSLKQAYPYNPPRFDAKPYIAPEGCEVKKYKPDDSISETCADEKYIFLDDFRYGLKRFGRYSNHNGRKFGSYFRVGSDLVHIRYNSTDGAYVDNIERDVFIVNTAKSDAITGDGK
jgi:hypothetical protein